MSLQASEVLDIEFTSEFNLSGSLYLPDTQGPYKVIIFIHGDGPANRTLDGGYNFIMNRLLESGYACFSYDKAGVSKSDGNWLHQSMADRAKEVLRVIPVIQEKIQVEVIGTLGFSQAGWVTSELALMDAPLDFYMVVGGAIDWLDQHVFYESQYAKALGFTEEETKVYLDYIQKSDLLIAANDYDGYANYVQSHDYESPMSKDRFNFVYLNHKANATEGIHRIQIPFLGLFGDSDVNVDAVNSIAVYEKVFKDNGNSNYDLHLIKDATHELLASKYNKSKNFLSLDALLYGDRIYADDALEILVDWLNTRIPYIN